jgi:FkbH-like protein
MIHCITSFNNQPIKRKISNHNFLFSDYSKHIQEVPKIFDGVNSKVIWISLEKISVEFSNLIANEGFDQDSFQAEIDCYTKMIEEVSNGLNVYVVDFYLGRNVVLTSNSQRKLVTWCISYANFKISTLDKIDIILSSELFRIGNVDFQYRLSNVAKIPYSNDVIDCFVGILDSIYNINNGSSKKLVVLDLDNTLWGGIVGDDGYENLLLDRNHYLGEAFIDFQNYFLSLKKQGILLALCSKNTEKVAIEAIQQLDNMVLSLNDIVSYRINWKSKSENISEIVQELNIGMDSVVFVDDNPVEREAVRMNLPEVTVVDLPQDPCLYKETVQRMKLFDVDRISSDDQVRTNSLRENLERKKSLSKVDTTDWLSMLNTKIVVEKVEGQNVSRALQLINKTNQFNLSTHRYTKEEFRKNIETYDYYCFKLSDKFGDLGIISIISIDKNGSVIDFVLSCRAMGRDVEKSILNYLFLNSCNSVKLAYIETNRNMPVLDFLQSYLIEKESGVFSMANIIKTKLEVINIESL